MGWQLRVLASACFFPSPVTVPKGKRNMLICIQNLHFLLARLDFIVSAKAYYATKASTYNLNTWPEFYTYSNAEGLISRLRYR